MFPATATEEPRLIRRMSPDAKIAIGLAVGVFVLQTLWRFPALHPQCWEELAVAAGLIPSAEPLHGIYGALASLLFFVLPSNVALAAVPIIGRICLALLAVEVYMMLRGVFALIPAEDSRFKMQKIGIWRTVSAAGACMFVAADPVWRAGQAFSSQTVFLLLFVTGMLLFVSFLRSGRKSRLFLAAACGAVLAAEGLIGLALTLVGVLVLMFRGRVEPEQRVFPLDRPFGKGLISSTAFNYLALSWALVLFAVIAFNLWMYLRTGGAVAEDASDTLSLILLYIHTLCADTLRAARPLGWLFGTMLSVPPLVIVAKMLPRWWNMEEILPRPMAALNGLIGLAAISQLGFGSLFWFWTWQEGNLMPSGELLSAFLFLEVILAVFACATFGIDAYCRNYRMIVRRMMSDEAGPDVVGDASSGVIDGVGRWRRMRKVVFLTAVILAVAAGLFGRRLARERAMLGAVIDSVRETLRETAGRDTVFTDGSLDRLLELEAFRRGRRLFALSFMGGDSVTDRRIRERAAENETDRELLARGAPGTLREWVIAGSDRLRRAAVQIGFEMWKRNRLGMPKLSGLVALPGTVDEPDLARAESAARDLGERILSLATEYDLASCSDERVRYVFPYVPWRLSRLARMRADESGAAGDEARQKAENVFADDLDAMNYAYGEQKRALERHSSLQQETPSHREWLLIALMRADFKLAAQHARVIVLTSPDDTRANFALGMDAYVRKDYKTAEIHLRKCVESSPEGDPAALNNLALAEMHLGRLEQARKHAVDAMKKYPSIPELKRTLQMVDERISASNKGDTK